MLHHYNFRTFAFQKIIIDENVLSDSLDLFGRITCAQLVHLALEQTIH